MTRRDYFAAAALQGLLANPTSADGGCTLRDMAVDAAKAADLLIEALKKDEFTPRVTQ